VGASSLMTESLMTRRLGIDGQDLFRLNAHSDLRNGCSQVIKNKLDCFAEGISKLGLTEVGYAIALLWYFDQEEARPELRPAYLAELMQELSLRRRVNVTRLGRQLIENRDVMRGKEMGTVRLRLASKTRLSLRYNEIAETLVTPRIDPGADAYVLPARLLENTRPYLEALALQINGTYQSGFYDACAVMCRRLLESLLLLAFERAAKGEVVRDASGDYRAFADIIGLASSNRHLKLPKGAGAVMGKIDYVGDLAAHHPTHTTRQQDIDAQRLGFARVISELVQLAEIKPKSAATRHTEVSASPPPP
jgi:hypothetical protein